MLIEKFKTNYCPTFQAKFLHSESLKQIADYAVEKGKFNKLNDARKNIDKAFLRTKLKVDIGYDDNKPFIRFTRFNPKSGVITPQTMDDLKLEKKVIYKSDKKVNILKFALEKLIKLGNSAPDNNMYKNIVIKK
ncbi:TPA: hypothetical protein IAC10_01345 [Candidatus Scatousia excrementigallinarum]|uniref:Uncharacterized protein n=1 Tax=Candidatus Scatousia excrementigallinarum TaxID=2840935 RepID=A0A9D1EX77_9BACT|nr:hypothetical protein [Candidatus Scatousia excrementigallinarum]